MPLIRTGLQLVLLGALFAPATWLVARAGLPVPPGLLALLALMALLLTRAVPEAGVDQGGRSCCGSSRCSSFPRGWG